jgi:hypothetical protein
VARLTAKTLGGVALGPSGANDRNTARLAEASEGVARAMLTSGPPEGKVSRHLL